MLSAKDPTALPPEHHWFHGRKAGDLPQYALFGSCSIEEAGSDLVVGLLVEEAGSDSVVGLLVEEAGSDSVVRLVVEEVVRKT